MVASLYLLSSLLVPAQVPSPAGPAAVSASVERRSLPPAQGDWLLTPRLATGQELVYRGSFTEQTGTGSVQLNRIYRFENRAFVLEAGPRGIDLAILTVLRDQAVAGSRAGDRVALKPGEGGEARSARLERVYFDLQGRPIAGKEVQLSVPSEGPPLLECGFCVAVPSARLGADRPWTVSEPGRPEMAWRIAGTEVNGGTACMRIEGVQTDGWDKPGEDRLGWRRRDTIWVSPRTGVAQRVERRIEHRAVGHEDATHVSILTYDLQSALQYPVPLAEDRRRELFQSLQLQQSARAVLAQPARHATQIGTLMARMQATHDAHAQTPYREALTQLRVRLEAAKRGETPPDLPSDVRAPASPEPARGLTTGKPAPDFSTVEMSREGRTASLRQWRGRPVVLIFFNPQSRSLDEMMELLQGIADRYKEIALVGLAMSDEAARVAELRQKRGWKMPVLSGAGLRITYAVEVTPKLVFLDGDGVVQGVVEGFGTETTSEIGSCVSRLIRR